MAAFELASSTQTPWFQALGRGGLVVTAGGTFAGTGTFQYRDADGVARPLGLSELAGTASFTAATGAIEIKDFPYPVRVDFDRDSGTLEIDVSPLGSQIYLLNADGASGGLTESQLPTADPEVSGALYISSGLIVASAGA